MSAHTCMGYNFYFSDTGFNKPSMNLPPVTSGF